MRELERERVTVQEAARQLGITESAVSKRVQRRLLEHDKEPDGRLHVYLDTQDTGRDEVRDSSYGMLVRRLENENEFLRRELGAQRHHPPQHDRGHEGAIPPSQEAPPDEGESPETADEQQGRRPHSATG